MNDEDLAKFFCQRVWRFARADGSIVVPELRLLPGGRFLNSRHANESTWRIRDGRIDFLNVAGDVTTTFTDARSDPDARAEFTGKFLGNPDSDTIHTLNEVKPQSIGRPSTALRTAVLVRTHIVSQKLWNLLESLYGSPLYDLYVLADTTHRRLSFPGVDVISHTVSMCKDLGLHTDFDTVLWKCGDFPIYCAASQIAKYDYYIQIEFDVHLIRQNSLFIEGIINRLKVPSSGSLDLVIPFLGMASPSWIWTAAAARRYPEVYRSFFPFIVMSARAVDHLLEERRREAALGPIGPDVVHCEAFCGTALIATGNYVCKSLEDIMPGSISWRTFHPQTEVNFLLGSYITPDPRIEMAHPVLEADAYLARALRQAKIHGKLDEFLVSLDQLDQNLVSSTLRDEFRRRALLP